MIRALIFVRCDQNVGIKTNNNQLEMKDFYWPAKL